MNLIQLNLTNNPKLCMKIPNKWIWQNQSILINPRKKLILEI